MKLFRLRTFAQLILIPFLVICCFRDSNAQANAQPSAHRACEDPSGCGQQRYVPNTPASSQPAPSAPQPTRGQQNLKALGDALQGMSDALRRKQELEDEGMQADEQDEEDANRKAKLQEQERRAQQQRENRARQESAALAQQQRDQAQRENERLQRLVEEKRRLLAEEETRERDNHFRQSLVNPWTDASNGSLANPFDTEAPNGTRGASATPIASVNPFDSPPITPAITAGAPRDVRKCVVVNNERTTISNRCSEPVNLRWCLLSKRGHADYLCARGDFALELHLPPGDLKFVSPNNPNWAKEVQVLLFPCPSGYIFDLGFGPDVRRPISGPAKFSCVPS